MDEAAIVVCTQLSDDGSRSDAADEIRLDDVIDWSRGVRYGHPYDYFMAVVGHDNAMRDAVLDCAHLYGLQLQRTYRTV